MNPNQENEIILRESEQIERYNRKISKNARKEILLAKLLDLILRIGVVLFLWVFFVIPNVDPAFIEIAYTILILFIIFQITKIFDPVIRRGGW